MRYAKQLILFLLIVGAGKVVGQTKIKCELVQIAYDAFSKNPNIVRSTYTMQRALGDWQIQRSAFDINSFSELSFQNYQNNLLGADPRIGYVEGGIYKTNSVNLSAGVRRRLRTSQLVEVSMNYGFANNNFPINNFNQPISTYLGNNASTLNFSLTQPLLRGRDRNIITAQEKAFTLYYKNAVSNNEYINSSVLVEISNAYWNYCSAFKKLDIYQQNEKRVRNILAVTEELVKGDKKPASDLIQVNADLANQERMSIQAQQELYTARIQLGKAVGLSVEESLKLDIPENDFPTVAGSAYKRNLDKADFIRLSLEYRADLRAALQGQEALQTQYQLAINNLKPQLDLTGFVSYGSVSVGNGVGDVLSSFVNRTGRNVATGAKLTFTFPVNNNFARGNLIKSNMALNDQQVVVNNLHRTIDLDVSNDLNFLHNSVLNLEKSENIFTYNQEVFKAEQAKFQAGLTTLLNLIIFQERLTNAQLTYIQAYRQFATAIINLRHDTGTLIYPAEKGFTIDQQVFYTIPGIKN